jgi:hypothetical protein
MMSGATSPTALRYRTRLIGHLDLAGAGQVTVSGRFAFVGHIPNKANLGTTIIDIADPAHPRIVAEITLDDPTSHSHKVRVEGGAMIVNHEKNPTAIGRRADELPGVRRDLGAKLGREPTPAEIAARLGIGEDAVEAVEAEAWRGYHNGGFKIYDVTNPARPREIVHQKTGGIGVHRFDMDARYAYISTEMAGYVGNILVVYDIADPMRPAEVSRWWIPGQHLAGGEIPSWPGRQHRLHHALRFGDEMWASCWHGGFSIVDVSDITKPRGIGSTNYHPLFPEPTHTAMPVPVRIGDRRIALAIDEEDQAQSSDEEHARRGRAHACILTFDVTDPQVIRPLGQFQVSEMDSPFSRMQGARFGAHQFCERMTGTIVHAVWFSGGLRIIDVANPLAPRETGWFIPEPAGDRKAPQTNDVALDDRGLIYLCDRNLGFDIVEFQGHQ